MQMNHEIPLVFERSVSGRGCAILPKCDVPSVSLPESLRRAAAPRLPELSEVDVTRHYTALSHRAFGVNCGFYPLGSCTMKYNPRLNEEMAALPGFTGTHPLAPEHAARGARKVYAEAEAILREVTGMDAVTFQPAAGAHGEFTGLLTIKQYHESRGESFRKKMLVPDSAHGTNPASAAMAGFEVVAVPSRADGCVDLDALAERLTDDVAGLMLTNPNTLGLFEKDILTITRMVHDKGGLVYYDGANLNAILGVARPGDMGFDVVHLNLHKTFSTPHGGGGPGAGPVGVKEPLRAFLPGCASAGEAGAVQVRSFHGNFLVVVRALCYMLSIGGDGMAEVAKNAVLNANYLMRRLSEGGYQVAHPRTCMHEFVLSLEALKKETGVSALDVAKGLVDRGMHPPTMYFPLIVHEALMFEPTETETRQTLDEAAEKMLDLLRAARETPDALHAAPATTPIGRPDEVTAARTPVLTHPFE